MTQNQHILIDLLLVEDNPADIELTLEAFSKSESTVKIHSAVDGQEALDFLYQQGKFTESPRPNIILLDINMPKKNGLEVLAIIKQDKELKQIPIIMLTTSDSPNDINTSYEHHANAYLRKPVDMEGFFKMVEIIEEFWLKTVVLPKVS